MTFIEFFDRSAVNNVGTCLTYSPDRVFCIGPRSQTMKQHIDSYEKLFADRGENIEFIPKYVTKSNLERAIQVLTDIVEQYDDCVFDITGGEEILCLALGIVYARYPEKNIQIHTFNLLHSEMHDCDNDGETVYTEPPALTVKENIRIYGGDIIFGELGGDKTYEWDMSPDFRNDIRVMWNICKENTLHWNIQSGVFERVCKANMPKSDSSNDDALTVTAPRDSVTNWRLRNSHAFKKEDGERIVNALLHSGLITYYYEDEAQITVSFKNAQVKKCISTAGQALEMKVYLTAEEMLDANGERVYNDAMNGVFIDWDGTPHDEKTENIFDTENEIDVLLMHDAVPIFVSCKNGGFDMEELYKLSTVAKRFGGEYARMALVTTSLCRIERNTAEFIRQRARDMHIKVVEIDRRVDDKAFEEKLMNLWLYP